MDATNKLFLEMAEQFAGLDKKQQILLIEKLNRNFLEDVVPNFSKKVKEKYDEDLEFDVEPITGAVKEISKFIATVHTPFGDFYGPGSTEEIAKAFACANAEQSWPKEIGLKI